MEAGDRVSITTKDREYEGVLMPGDKSTVILKLESGYNIGIAKKSVTKQKVLKKASAKRVASKKVVHKKGLPSITILHTGGTIASKVDYDTGAVASLFTPEEILAMVPELKSIANVDARLVRNMWSEDMRFAHYNIIAKEIAKEIKKGVDGIIVTSGTDTMHYTSAALSFMLENLSVPVILTAAQRSSDRASSDAASNLIAAARVITETDFVGVAIAMHHSSDDKTVALLPGLKTKKLHSSRRDAFKAVNAVPLAFVDVVSGEVKKNADWSSLPQGKLTVKAFKEDLKVGVLRVHTNMWSEEFSAFKSFDGLLIEGTGIAGNIPINKIDELTDENAKIAKTIEALFKKGVVVAVSTQTVSGRLDMNVYTTGKKMQELGIIGNYHDMPTDTAFIKLAWLLSNYSREETKKLFARNLRGEISERSKYEVGVPR